MADTTYDEIVLVLEGEAKSGVTAGRDGHVRTVHARGRGDDAIVQQTRPACDRGARVTVVTADRLLRARVVQLGASVMSPLALLDEVI